MHTFRNLLCQYFLRINHMQIIGQSIRQNISKNPYFQYQTIFQRLDKYHKGYLIPDDLSQFMVLNKIYPSQEELYITFRLFDRQRVGAITIDRFAEEIFPKQNQKLKKQSLNKKYYSAKQRLELDLEYLIGKYFEHKIKQHNELQEIRKKLRQIYLNYSEEAFALIDKNKKMYLDIADIELFFRSNGKILKKQQLLRIFRGLSGDQLNIKLQLIQFVEHLDPFVNGFYSGYKQRILQKQKAYQIYLEQKIALKNQVLLREQKQLELIKEIQQIKKSRYLLDQQLLKNQIQSSRKKYETQIKRLYY